MNLDIPAESSKTQHEHSLRNVGAFRTRQVWQDDETVVLLKSWRDHMHIHRNLKKTGSKNPLYYAVSKDLLKYGYHRSIKEVYFKMKNLGRYLRKAKKDMAVHGYVDFKFYDEVDELLKMEAEILGEDDRIAKPQVVHVTEQPQIVLDGSYIETVASENSSNVQVIRLNIPDNQDASDSNQPLYTVISHAEPEVQNEQEGIQVTVPHSSSYNSQKAPENILLGFYKEFERSNRQLEKNDAAMLELFKEQNDIFRTQTTLLMKLLLK